MTQSAAPGTPKPRLVACPRCGVSAPWSTTNPWRPFCSERCKTIDLGAWASEAYRIPVDEPDPGSDRDGD
ncbi:MAG: DNA gyrase inhibitor YacG [Burkholderiales bacterium]|nr:DNA gyrase inhibitor YacG [Burkholderiales bacterium]